MNSLDDLGIGPNVTDNLTSIYQSMDDDSTVGVKSFILESVAAELGFFYAFAMIAVGLLLDQVNGKIFRLKIFLMNRNFQLVQNAFFIKFINVILRMLCWIFLLMPLFSLGVWGSGLLIKSANLDESYQGGICVLLVGLALICYSYGFLTIRWNNFRFSTLTIIYLGIAQLSFSAYQFVAILFDKSFDNFFGYSCVFLSLNCILMMLLIFLHSGIEGASMREFLMKLPNGEPRDEKREVIFDKELKQERFNEDQVISQEDVYDIFTIGKVSETQLKGAFGGGVSKLFARMAPSKKRLFTLVMWGVSAGVLVAYSFAVYYAMNSWLGFLTMTAILTTDVILFCIFKSKVIKSATMLCFTLILNRFFLIIFGGDYWIYGYMILYIYYGIILTKQIGTKRFPFEGAYNAINLDNIQKRRHHIDVSRIPEFLFGLITVLYVVLFVALAAINPDPSNIPLKDLKIGQTTYEFYMIGIFSIILVVLLFCLYCTYRLFIRKKKRINPTMFYFIQNKSFDLYWIFITATYLLLIVISLITYWATEDISFLIVGVLGSLSIILYLNAILYYSMNEFRVFQDITSINQKVSRHNKRITELKSKVTQLQKDIQEGNINQIGGAENAGLAQRLIQTQKEEKKKQKTIRLQRQVKDGPSPKVTSKLPFGMMHSNKPKLSPQAVAPVLVLTDKQLKQQEQFEKQTRGQTVQAQVNIQGTLTANQSLPGSEGLKSIDRIIKEELDNSKQQEDDMYEGGDQDLEISMNASSSQLGQTQMLKNLIDESDSDDSEQEFDPDNDQAQDGKSISKSFRLLPDWKSHTNGFAAYFSSQLRKNDYQIINSFILGFISLTLMAWLVCKSEGTLLGITIAIPFLHYGMAFFSFIRSLNTDSNMTFGEYAIFFLSYAIQYAWGVFNLFWLYNVSDMDPSDPGAAPAGYFIVVYLIVIPFITSITSAVAKWIDDKGRFTLMFLIQMVITFIQGIGMLVCAYLFLTVIPGIIISVVIVVLAYIVLQVWIYFKNDYYLPKAWQIINMTIIISLIAASFIAGLCIESFANFLGFSISIWILSFFILLYSFAEITSDIKNIGKKPIFISPWIFPVYIYNPKKNDVEPHNMPAVALIVGFCLLILWAILASIWIKPTYLGVGLSIIFELALIIIILYLVQQTMIQMHDVQPYIDNMLIRTAWNDAKMGYINGRGAPNREQLLTYEKMKLRRDNFRNFLRKKEGRGSLNFEEKFEQVTIIDDSNIDIEWIDESQVDLSNNNSMYSYLFQIEKDLSKIYIEELELVIQFQLLLIQQAANLQEQERKYLFTFLTEKKTALFALGIVINIPEEGTLSVRYARVITQIQKLSPEKQTMFNTLRESFIIEQRKNEEQIKERAKIEEEKQKERMKAMAEMSDQKRKLLESVNENMNVDEMPDCEMKYNKILKECKAGKIFSDIQFGPNDKSLGPGCLNRGLGEWVRARDKPDMVLYKDQINHEDVVQGALGDCYFLSAISVLGEKYVKKIIMTIEDQEEWRTCGAFCVKFYKNGYEEIIIVDDYFPAYANGDWAFVKGGIEGKELWPMVLEKAYAKMYGSYNYIEAGKVQYALADMTDGFPEQIDLKTDGKNIQVFWEQLKTLARYGCLMGAGSPEHPQGDAHINEMGIVQGHAYAVLDVQEVDTHRLVQLRNPHGSTGAEWKGDWADEDVDKWTERMRQKLVFEDKNDGVFWMDVLDFIEQYSFLYICRKLNAEDGWIESRIQGMWKGPTAEGLPTRANPNARLDFNPQYEITITKPCDGFISLSQMDHVNMFKGKHSQFFMVSKVEGQRITKVDKASMVCRSGAPINLNIITSECDFYKSVRYPYKFTLMVANAEHGEEGEGEFQLIFYATDPNVKITELPFPEDMPRE